MKTAIEWNSYDAYLHDQKKQFSWFDYIFYGESRKNKFQLSPRWRAMVFVPYWVIVAPIMLLTFPFRLAFGRYVHRQMLNNANEIEQNEVYTKLIRNQSGKLGYCVNYGMYDTSNRLVIASICDEIARVADGIIIHTKDGYRLYDLNENCWATKYFCDKIEAVSDRTYHLYRGNNQTQYTIKPNVIHWVK